MARHTAPVNWAAFSQITVTMSNPPSPVPAGAMGVFPRLFRSDGRLEMEAHQWFYNRAGQTRMDYEVVLINVPVGSAYYAHGLTQAWHGTGYWTFDSFRTPNVTAG